MLVHRLSLQGHVKQDLAEVRIVHAIAAVSLTIKNAVLELGGVVDYEFCSTVVEALIDLLVAVIASYFGDKRVNQLVSDKASDSNESSG